MIGLYDIHCHLIPGVDDGAECLEQSMEMLKMEYDCGVRHLVLTPHFRRGMFETDLDTIEREFNRVREAAKKTYPEMTLYLGSEFHANLDMCDMLQEDERYFIGDTPCLLTEFSYMDGKKNIQNRLYELRQAGVVPIVAHVERYPALCGDLELMRSLKKLGVLFQINADSVLGHEGIHAKRLCMKLLKYELAELIASDAHNTHSRAPCLGRCAQYLEKKLGKERTEMLFTSNPQMLLSEKRG